MNGSTRSAGGRIGIAAVVVLLLLAVVLYFYSERAAPPEPEPSAPARPAPQPEPEPEPDGAGEATTTVPTDTAPPRPVPAAPGAPERSPPTEIHAAEPEPSLEESAARLRVAIAERLAPDQLPLLASDRLLERIVATVHSLDGDPVPLRFRPLAHVPDLPRVVPDGEHWRLPPTPDPRYRPYRALFDRFDAETLAALFARHEDALQRAWVRLGESGEATFRRRLIEVLRHVADYDLPARRPSLHRPEVLYEFVDPELESLSWSRKLLIRIGPGHAAAVQARAAELADRLTADE
jgi:hypothetical protein